MCDKSIETLSCKISGFVVMTAILTLTERHRTLIRPIFKCSQQIKYVNYFLTHFQNEYGSLKIYSFAFGPLWYKGKLLWSKLFIDGLNFIHWNLKCRLSWCNMQLTILWLQRKTLYSVLILNGHIFLKSRKHKIAAVLYLAQFWTLMLFNTFQIYLSHSSNDILCFWLKLVCKLNNKPIPYNQT